MKITYVCPFCNYILEEGKDIRGKCFVCPSCGEEGCDLSILLRDNVDKSMINKSTVESIIDKKIMLLNENIKKLEKLEKDIKNASIPSSSKQELLSKMGKLILAGGKLEQYSFCIKILTELKNEIKNAE